MNGELPPLSDDIEKLLSSARGFPPVPGPVEARMWSALAPQLATLPLAAHAGSAAGHLSRVGLAAKLSAKWPLAVAFALGGGAGVGVHAAWVRPQPQIVHAAEAVAVAPVPSPVAPAPLPLPAPAPKSAPAHVVRAPAVAAPPTPVVTAPDDPGLTSERALLEMGRTALARGQNRAAYEAMVEHEQRFPQGRLSEERDAIQIQALVGLGQLDAARLLGQSFRAAYPKSLLLPAVDRALKEGK